MSQYTLIYSIKKFNIMQRTFINLSNLHRRAKRMGNSHTKQNYFLIQAKYFQVLVPVAGKYLMKIFFLIKYRYARYIYIIFQRLGTRYQQTKRSPSPRLECSQLFVKRGERQTETASVDDFNKDLFYYLLLIIIHG